MIRIIDPLRLEDGDVTGGMAGAFGGLGRITFSDLGSLTDRLPGRKSPSFEIRHSDGLF